MSNYISLLFLFLASVSFGQTTISGEVFDSITKQPMEFVQVKLLSSQDSLVKGGAFTDEKGKFLIDDVKQGNYFVQISFSGYEERTVERIKIVGQPVFSIGKVILKTVNIKEIEELTVVGKLEVLSAGIDKKVYNVDQDVAARGASADEVLNNIPSIALDEDGRITLRGEGSVTVLINGQPSSLTGSGGDLLSSIPASSIERIEVVTNPSAKYDPDGTSGIINIVLKKNKLRGINGQVAATGAFPFHDHKLSAALSFRNDKINAYASYAFDYLEGYRNNYSAIYRPTVADSAMLILQNRQGTDFRRGHMGRVGLDWYMNNANTIGFSVNSQTSDRRRGGDQDNLQYFFPTENYNEWNRKSFENNSRDGVDMNIYFNHNLKDNNGKFSMSVNQSLSKRNEDSDFEQVYRIWNSSPSTISNVYQRQLSKSNNGIFTAQADFEQIIPKLKMRYEVGAKAILRNEKLNANSSSYDILLQQYVGDTLANYDYRYNENVYSVYGTLGQELGKFKYQVGVRGEYVLQDPRLLSENKVFTKEYLQLYPSAHVRYTTSEKSEISLGYSRRVNRPSAGDLNPFTNYSDPYNLRSGNPDLKPEFINSIDLGYMQTFKSMSFNANVYYRHTTDVIQRVKLFMDNNTSAVTMANLDNSQTIGLELIYQFRPFTWWRNTISFNGNYIDYTSSSALGDWNNNGIYWGAKYTGSFDFWKKTATFQVNATYNAPRVTAQGTIYMWNFVDFSVQKQLLDKKLVIGLRLADAFDIKGFKMKINQPTLNQYAIFDFQTRRLYLTLTYKFGKMDISQKQLPKDTEGGGGGDF